MFSTAAKLTLFTILLVFEVKSYDIETLTNHSNILNQFPEYTKRTISLEKRTSDLESSVTVIEVDTSNLQTDVSELTNVSIAYTEKLNYFVSYETKSVKLESMASYLVETLEKYGGSLNVLGSQNRRTKDLENFVVEIKQELHNDSHERNNISLSLESVRQNYTDAQGEIQTKLGNIDMVEVKQNETWKKLDDYISAISARKDSVAENTSSLLEKCTVEQDVKTKLQNLENLPKVQDETSKKLNDLISQVEKHNSANSNLESLRNKFNAEQNEIKKQMLTIDPLANSQTETIKQLDQLYSSLEQVAKEQLEQEKILKQLSDQLQAFIKSHTSLI